MGFAVEHTVGHVTFARMLRRLVIELLKTTADEGRRRRARTARG
jgi:hypothetical protein